MKQTRTTLKELTAAYRAVLRHGILCNAIALGLIATPAMAARLPIVGGDPVTETDMVYSGNLNQDFGGGIDNYGGTVTETNVTLQSNSATRGGGANNDGTMTLNGGLIGGATADLGNQGSGGAGIANTGTLTIDGTILQNNVASNYGGGIYNSLDNSGTSAATVSVSNAVFRDNSAGQYGGAIYSLGREDIVTGALNITTSNFFNNSAASAKAGGAIYLLDSGNMTIKGSTFGGYDETDPENPISLGNTAGKGGAVYIGGVENPTHGETTVTITKDASDNKTIFDHNVANGTGEDSGFGGALVHNGFKTFLDLSDAEFTNNSATDLAGALLIGKTAGTQRLDGLAATINNVLFANNTAAGQGGALWNGAKANITNTEFRNNSTTGTIEGGGAVDLGAVSKTTFDNTTFTSNTSTTSGGALATRGFSADNSAATLDITNSVFTGNSAVANGGAIDNNFYHSATAGHTDAVYIADSTFATNNAANGGAIYNNKGATQTGSMYLTGTIFTKNTATGDGGAINNQGTLTVSNAVFGDADDATLLNSANTGGAIYNIGTLTVEDSEFYNNQATYFGAIRDKVEGTGVTITGSKFVGNTADEVGAVGIFSRGGASSISGSEFINNSATATGAGVDGTGALFVGAEANLTVSDTTFTGNTSVAQAGAIGTRGFNAGNNVAAKLSIKDSVFKGNIAATEGGALNNYLYGSSEAGHTDAVYISGSTFGGEGVGEGNSAAKGGAIYNHIAQSGDANPGQTGSIYLVDSSFINNTASDFGGAIYNEGVATVAADGTNVLFSGNTANGNLNDIYNVGTLNLSAAENQYISLAGGITGNADTIASNIVNISGNGYITIDNALTYQTVNNSADLRLNADLTGTTITNTGGSIDIRNGVVDSVDVTISGGGLYVDADLNAATNKIDSFTSVTGATIKGISLIDTGYGTGNKVTLSLDGATFDDDVAIDGFSYYTQVVNNGSSLVFRDKLLNESGMYTNLGSWTGGHYIAANVDLDHEATENTYLTVGDALTELDKQLYAVSTAGAIADGDTGFVTGDAVYDALASYSTTGEMNTAISDALNTAVADGGVVDSAIDSAITAAVGTNGAVTNAIDGALNTAVADGGVVDSAIDSAITAAVGTNGAVTNAIDGALNTAVADGGVIDSAIDDKITTSLADGGAINTAINGAVTTANTYTDNAIANALGQVNESVTAAYDHAHEWAESLLGVDVDANVNTQLQTALSDLATADNTTNSIESTTIAGALHELDTDVAAVDERLTTAEGTLTTHNNALATLNGDESTDGSVVKTVKDNAQNATYTNSGGSSSLANASTVGGALNLLGSATDDNISAIALLNGDESTEGSVAYAAANAVATANAYTDSKLSETRDSAIAASNAYTDRRIEDLDKNLSAGVAGAVALSAVATSGVERGEVSVGAGYGYFNGQSAAAFGATMGLSNRWSINAGAGISNADVSFRAGTNYKFKLF